MRIRGWLFTGLLVLVNTCFGSAEPLLFSSEELEQRYLELTQELRCLVCQNQNLADSDAPLAQDLRQEIHTMLESGQSNSQIKSFLVDRYGDFVLYRPPVGGNTLMLWLVPLLLLIAGAGVVFAVVRRYNRLPAEESAPTSRPAELFANENKD